MLQGIANAARDFTLEDDPKTRLMHFDTRVTPWADQLKGTKRKRDPQDDLERSATRQRLQ